MRRPFRILAFTLTTAATFTGSATSAQTTSAKSTAPVTWNFVGPKFTAPAAGASRQWTLASDAPQEKLVRVGPDGTPLTYYGARAKSDQGEVVFVTCDRQALPIQKTDAIATTDVPCRKIVFTASAYINQQFAAGAIGTATITKSALSKSATAALSQSSNHR